MPDPKALYSAVLDLSRAAVLVVGAGEVAARKLQGLPEGCGRVRIVAPEACAGVKDWLRAHPGAEWLPRAFEPGDLKGRRLVFCCASDPEANAMASRQAAVMGVWACRADEPALGDLRVPAVVRAGGLEITLSTGGASPAMARALRARFEAQLGSSDLAWLLKELEKLRPRLKADPGRKAALIKALTSPKALDHALAPRSKERRARLLKLLKGKG